MERIGPYKLIRSIAKGGMGEVLLAYDPICKREVALKRIRSEYLENATIHKRFIKEALIASQLTHPNIIPIYDLCTESDCTYYTMPYVQGKTLKQTILEAKEQQKNFRSSLSSESSVPYLVNIFTTICEAVAYAHTHQIIHRDLKPENILIGKHGEVIIFDWGVADKVENITDEEPLVNLDEMELSDLTSPGKVIGTLSFLAPERFDSQLSSYLTDIYSLGVMLYMILTLSLPFKRKKLKEAKKNLPLEKFKNPIDVAPYRDIPHSLVTICKKCLQPNPKNRYQSMQELIKDIRDFTEGHPEWISADELDISDKTAWQFNENILISNHQAISLEQNALEWVTLLLSEKSFETNVQLKVSVCLKEGCQGIGLVINSPKAKARRHIIDGYHLWLSGDQEKPSLLFRNNVEVLRIDHLSLAQNQLYVLRLEKMHNRIYCYIDNELIFSYLSYLPLVGTYVGFVSRDSNYSASKIEVSVTSPPLIISCLEVPDSFFLQMNWDKALIEYRRIGKAFTGRHESREAFFRAGLTVLEKAQAALKKADKQDLFDQALKEFEQLRHTPGAPLEYLGKALVYQHQKDIEEELKCLELALRRYPNHPLLYLIYDHIIYRLYQSSHSYRLDTHKFIFLALRYNAYSKQKQMIDPLILNLTDRKKMFFFLEEVKTDDLQSQYLQMIVNLGFLLHKNYVFEEILENYSVDKHFIRNILIVLWYLNENETLNHFMHLLPDEDAQLINCLSQTLSKESLDFISRNSPSSNATFEESIALILIDQGLCHEQYDLISSVLHKIMKKKNTLHKEADFAFYYALSLLLSDKREEASQVMKTYTLALEQTPHRYLFLRGCYLALQNKEAEAIELFKNEHKTALPDVNMLASLYLSEQLDYNQWKKEAFVYEKKQLYKQLYFFYHISGQKREASAFKTKWKNLKL